MAVPYGFELVALHYPFNQPKAIRITNIPEDIENFGLFIQSQNINQAEIVTDNIEFLRDITFLKHFRICPPMSTAKGYDFSPLYSIPEIVSLSCKNQYGTKAQYMSLIDYSQINGLVDLFVSVNKGTLNFNKIKSLRSLRIVGFKGKNRNLTDMFCSEELDTLQILQSGITSLNGVSTSKKIQCLYLSHNRTLDDISALRHVSGTLKALRISNCPRITDFSVLGELENIELLELSGSNTLPNLKFLHSMKNLKTFIFNVNVLDGDLTPCLPLSYVNTSKNRKHYNLRNSELPKNTYYHGNENIEEWRRLE